MMETVRAQAFDQVAPLDPAICMEEARQALAADMDYRSLGAIADRLEECGVCGNTLELVLLRTWIFRKTGEWDRAATILTVEAERFGWPVELLYEAALTSLDANRYAQARGLFVRLVDRISDLSDRQRQGLRRGASLIGMHDLALAALDAMSDHPIPKAPLEARIRSAIVNQRIVRDLGVRLVSLGSNCLPWMVGNRWGLRVNPASEDEDSLFNLAQCAPHSAASVILDRARTFLDPISLSVLWTEIGTPMPAHAPYGFGFNHEQGSAFVDMDFANLRHRYARRVENFQRAFQGSPRLFLYYVEQETDLRSLVTTLDLANADGNYRLLIVDARPASLEPQPHPRVGYVSIPTPSPDYVWYRPADHDTAEGVAFERAMAEAVLAEMRNLRS
jgi:hypothetical protein